MAGIRKLHPTSIFVKVALLQQSPRGPGRLHGLVVTSEPGPGTPGEDCMRMDELTGCPESPDTIPLRQSGLTRSPGHTAAPRPALSDADPQLCAEDHSRHAPAQLA